MKPQVKIDPLAKLNRRANEKECGASETNLEVADSTDEVGRRGWTRTSDHLLRRQVLYPPELRARVVSLLILNYLIARRR